ncbi:hypothetical protein F4821DRAFT_238371 [Hypoxylon rubiginosum]|uniref:Uncharacterized protein n=1 Tax=Hypoxylon rubiginosum TaxID=110542 RepID=A0ACC0D185_9PEZI|nr:hypothetical protein F4821DRAFT_238371 [Hypoxylon rubiginosum]
MSPPCGCIKYIAIYPCGHELATFECCTIAKAKSLLKRGPPTPCASYSTWKVSPDLQETCGSTCLTKPFQCRHCGADKQVSWRCSQCNILRDPDTPVWDLCACPRLRCSELVLGKPGAALCGTCETGACVVKSPADREREMRRPTGMMNSDNRTVSALSWKCHQCARLNRTPANAMVCECKHQRCGHCSALFGCNCKCGCDNTFVEGGPGVCDSCVKSSSCRNEDVLVSH